MNDNDLILTLLRERRWYIEAILDGTIEAKRKPKKMLKPARRMQLARVNAEIARRVVQQPDTYLARVMRAYTEVWATPHPLGEMVSAAHARETIDPDAVA